MTTIVCFPLVLSSIIRFLVCRVSIQAMTSAQGFLKPSHNNSWYLFDRHYFWQPQTHSNYATC
ncbi:hypothetical protein HanPSC8_Chr17g0785921 [Helianthus annuus]|nr:hypothetical protein HanPSC8_Chr17g0785921 [Helianthus annuus]